MTPSNESSPVSQISINLDADITATIGDPKMITAIEELIQGGQFYVSLIVSTTANEFYLVDFYPDMLPSGVFTTSTSANTLTVKLSGDVKHDVDLEFLGSDPDFIDFCRRGGPIFATFDDPSGEWIEFEGVGDRFVVGSISPQS